MLALVTDQLDFCHSMACITLTACSKEKSFIYKGQDEKFAFFLGPKFLTDLHTFQGLHTLLVRTESLLYKTNFALDSTKNLISRNPFNVSYCMYL